MVPNFKIKTGGLQSKILILFLIALGSVLFAAYYVRENERILRYTLLELTKPEKRLTQLHNILTIIPDAENKLRYYALTNNQYHYDHYNVLIDSIEHYITHLRNDYLNDSLTNIKFDSINLLLNQRREIISNYIDVKNNREKINFANKAFSTISKSTPMTMTKPDNTRPIIITDIDTISKTQDSLDKKEGKGFFRKIKEAFSKKENNIPNQTSQDTIVKTITRIEKDTSGQLYADSNIYKSINEELKQIEQSDLISYNNLRDKELNLLQNSSMLIDQVTDIFRRIERDITNESELRSSEARQKASQSLLIIGIVSLLSLSLIMLLIILILISVRKGNRYRKELILSNIQANELTKVKEEFLANMSHEIRTPLNAIIGFTDLLISTKVNNEQAKYLNAVKQSSRHLLDTVNDILDLSKLVAGKFQIDNHPFNFSEVMKDTISPFSIQASEKGLLFNYSCNVPPDLSVLGDALRLRQVLYNLLSNAIKFTGKGSVTVECQVIHENDRVRITIIINDTGIGIPQEKLETIFEDFQQVDSSSARAYGGSGLGLAISRRLARLQNGDITVTSKQGEGSAFSFQISYKVSDESLEAPVRKESSLIRTGLKDKKLLIVDDDPFSIMLSKIIGEKNEMHVQIAEDGYKAINYIDNQDFDLIMTDLQMPGITGVDLIKHIRNSANPKTATLPVLAFTANKIDKYDNKLISEGFNEILQKPFLEDELIERISHYLSIQYDSKNSSNTNPAIEINNNTVSYSLDQVKLFSGGKSEQEIMIIESFIQSAKIATAEMIKANEEKNFAEIKNLAHRSLTAYQLFKVKESVELLEKLDNINLNHIKEEKVNHLLIRLSSMNEKMFEHLHNELIQLKKG